MAKNDTKTDSKTGDTADPAPAKDTPKAITDSFLQLLEQAAEDTGADLKGRAAELATYASTRAQHLSTLVGDPQFPRALADERDNFVLKCGVSAVNAGDSTDNRIRGIVQGALGMAARLLATV